MKLTTVLGSVNDNPEYYMFIPKQIHFWNKFNIRFIAIFVGKSIPTVLEEHKDNIILWDTMLYLNTAYLGQNLRMYYAALLDLPAGEAVMLTDMDMLPMSAKYYISGLDSFNDDNFIYYRNIEGKEIFMCYNAAHPSLWAKLFNINNKADIEHRLFKEYNFSYTGIPHTTGWFTDQYIMYNTLNNYPGLQILNRPLRRLEMGEYAYRLKQGHTNFINEYDDAHFHRSYYANEQLILDAEKQLAFFPLI
jgi:hypothetical protein